MAHAPRAALLTAALAVCGTPGLEGQASHEQPPPVAAWIEDVGLGMANAFTGGVTAAVTAWLGDGDVGRAMVRGMLGGAVVFVGKRIVVEDFDGAGLLGRQVAAVGSSIVRNGGAGASWLEEVWLPLGPFWLQANPGSSDRFRLDAWRMGALFWAATRPELRMDWGASASSGAFVFRAPGHAIRDDGDVVSGLTMGSLVLLGPGPADRVGRTRGHELVHVVQHDFDSQAWGRPLESWAWRRFMDRTVPVDFGLASFLRYPLLYDLHQAEAGTLDAR